MNENEQKTEQKQLCSIRIAFAVETDEQAIEYKKKVSEVLSSISSARIEFNLMPIPAILGRNAPSPAKFD